MVWSPESLFFFTRGIKKPSSAITVDLIYYYWVWNGGMVEETSIGVKVGNYLMQMCTYSEALLHNVVAF